MVMLCLVLITELALAQQTGGSVRTDGQGRPIGPNSKMRGGDSLQQRDNTSDSITIFYRMFDSSRVRFFDSSVSDINSRFPLKSDYLYLGSLGNAAHSVLFQPNMKPGFDPGFHAYDLFKYTIENTRIFQTTRPYTELDYILGSRSEQTIRILHTQNISPTWNAAFEFGYVGTPGQFKNNNTSLGNLRLSSGFTSKNRRYSGNFIYFTNRIKSSTNGGIESDSFLNFKNSAFDSRFNIPTNLGGDGDFSTNFFASSITTGHEYKNRQLFFRHQYDFGQKDSIVNEEDSSVTRLFYARFRLQHTLSYNKQSYLYRDEELRDTGLTNEYANVYRQRFGVKRLIPLMPLNDEYTDITNEAAFLAYPQKNNQDQFLKAGAGFQLLDALHDSATSKKYNNLYLLGEYRNRTRNKRWDINAFGRLYLSGLNAGDYTASLSLQTQLGKKAGTLLLSFQNTNRTPSMVFDQISGFINQTNKGLKKENWTRFSGTYYLPLLKMKLLGNYYLVNNYAYWDTYTTFKQESTITSVLHVGAEKTFKLTKHWNWHGELHIQTETSDAINLPTAFTRNRIAYEGLFFKNLNLSTGIEFRYFVPYTADDFSPFNGQWVLQDTATISNRPDIAAFLHFRVRSFRLFTRLENLNTLDLDRGFKFLQNNFAAPLYPTPGLLFRLGIYWGFVN
jgi:hypothetical protein